jgi:hypothetical protein
MPSRHPESAGLAGGTPGAGREKFAFSIAEVTDALALEVLTGAGGGPARLDLLVAAVHLNLVRKLGNTCRYSATGGLTLSFAVRGWVTAK